MTKEHTNILCLVRVQIMFNCFLDLVLLLKSQERISSDEMQMRTGKEKEITSEMIGQIYIYHNKILTMINFI